MNEFIKVNLLSKSILLLSFHQILFISFSSKHPLLFLTTLISKSKLIVLKQPLLHLQGLVWFLIFFLRKKEKKMVTILIRQVMCRIWILKRKISCKKQLVNDGYEVWRKRFVVSKKLTISLGHLLRLS